MTPRRQDTFDDQAPLKIPNQEHHRPKPTPFGPFAATALSVPLISVTVLPLSVIYQAGRTILSSVTSRSNSKNQKSTISIDSGYKVDPSQIIPRAQRTYDVVVLGATGFTGYLAARYLCQTYGCRDDNVKWAIAGRSQAKLDKVKERLATELNMPEARTNIDTLIVDTSIPATLPNLVAQAKCVATTAGPYTLYGSHVVEFCAKFGTHYVDITGEVDWVKAMVVQWQSTAQQTGAKLISFCGHDSIPWDLCVYKMQQEMQEKCQDDLATVTFWDEMRGEAPGGTLATVLNSIEGNSVRAPRGDFDPFLKLPDGSKSKFVAKAQNPSFIAKSNSPWDKAGGKTYSNRWTAPFLMAGINSQVVRWSHALRRSGNPSLVYREMQVCPDFRAAFLSFFGLAAFGTMLLNPLTSTLMKKYVLPKPGDGPSMDKMVKKHYLTIYGEGIGVKGNRAECIMYFPRDVGCLDTSRMLIESALTLVQDEEKLPSVGGGFWTPSTAMGQRLLDRLVDTGTHFLLRVVKKEEVTRAKL